MRCLDTVADNQQRQGADQSKKRRECRYKAYLFKVGHDASPTQHLRIGKNKNGDSRSVCSLSDASTEIFWDGVLPSTRFGSGPDGRTGIGIGTVATVEPLQIV